MSGGAPPMLDLVAGRVHAALLRDVPSADGASLRTVARVLAREEAPLLDDRDLATVVDRVLARVTGLGPLDRLLDDPEVTEIMVNGPGRPVWVERAGGLHAVDLVLDAQAIGLLIERVVAPLGLRADRTSPLVDARLPDGSRVNAALPPLAVDGPYLTVRRFRPRPVGLDELCAPPVAALLALAVAERRNVVVSGGTGAGKTTLLNALAARIPSGERIVTIEDAAELRLPHAHVVRLEARPANAEGQGEVRLRALVRNALRMRPDRIVVGEVRGPEALDMVQALNTGHDGSLTTCHANSPADALRRLETMVLEGGVGLPLAAIREQLMSSVDMVVHVGRLGGGRRGVVAVDEVVEASRQTPGGPLATRRLADGRRVVAQPDRRPR